MDAQHPRTLLGNRVLQSRTDIDSTNRFCAGVCGRVSLDDS